MARRAWREPCQSCNTHPMQNAHIERFNPTYREEVLALNVFPTLADARQIKAAWMQSYNAYRHEYALQSLSPHQ